MLKPKRQRYRVFTSFVRRLPSAQGRSFRRNLLFLGITLGLIAFLTMVSGAHAAGLGAG